MTRCVKVQSLLDRYMDGVLAPNVEQAVRDHLATCSACARSFALAQGIAEALASPAPLPAPEGLHRRVMDEVYRLAMAGYPHRAGADEKEAQRGRFYRRLGLCFMLSAAILAVSLVIPRVSYPTIFAGTAVAADLSSNGARIARITLIDADRVVRGTLMKPEGPAGNQNRGDFK